MKCYLFYDGANRPAIIVIEADSYKALSIAQERMNWPPGFAPLFRQIAVEDGKAIVLDFLNIKQHVGA